MSIRFHLSVFAAAAGFAIGCSGAQPTSPTVSSSSSTVTADSVVPAAGALARVAGGVERAVAMFDACDPATFDAVLGAGSCTRSGGMTFENFIELLGRHHAVGPWRFSPGVVTMRAGEQLVAVNNGGEVHTFTEVEEFGGGIVGVLNNLTGTPTVAPECTQLMPADFLAPGQRSSETEDDEGVEKYQCCIHPWMRAEVRITDK